MTKDDIDFSKAYIKKIKRHIEALEMEMNTLKDMVYHMEEGIMDEEDKYWDAVYKSYQERKFAINF